ncbi:MFS transporter [Mycolicibacterium sp. J2]|jgi:MFS family permease|uniref:MFS transporter n=1 Tax=Mycolicibacterium sp. J2 TaxID=2993511 RepID=UPI00224AC183|nr:MFS transporter [Mycolicibacterium sp. J2]MCX2715475.1 MFS transporter [Mycolicibacterium sp. J2]
MTTADAPELRRSLRALNAVNFFIADVQAGLGPFLGVYLINMHGWNPASIGVMLTLGGAIGLFLNAPAGALIDRSTHKRTLLAVAAALTSVGTFIVTLEPTLAVVTAAQLLTGIGGVVVGPVLAAMALGLVGPKRYAAQTGQMTAFNHAGNVVGSTVAGLAGYLVSLKLGFWIASLFGIFVVATTLMIKSSLIDNRLARGLEETRDTEEQPSGLRVLLHNRPLLVLAAVVGLWQLANGAMLPIAGQQLALGHSHVGALYQAALIIVAQLVMIPMALLTGSTERWGRKPLFLVAFAVLPLRGLLFACTSSPAVVIAIQGLDGVGAGLQGPLFAVMVADLTRGTGRYNIAMGAATMVQGIGGALSPTLAGAVYAQFGYAAAMFTLTAISVLALTLLVIGVPETLKRDADSPARDDQPEGEATVAG